MNIGFNFFVSLFLLLNSSVVFGNSQDLQFASDQELIEYLKKELNFPINKSCKVVEKQKFDPVGPFEKTDYCNDWEFASLQEIAGKVYRVVDGDTIHFYARNKLLAIRMLGIDTGELHFQSLAQPTWGNEAKFSLNSMVSTGDTITLQLDKLKCDRYGRILGHVFKNKVNLNYEQVRRGYAANYCIYPNLKHCRSYSLAYLKAEEEKIGIHADSCFVTPYVWRRALSQQPMDKKVRDYRTDKVYQPADYYKIPVAYRVFYPN